MICYSSRGRVLWRGLGACGPAVVLSGHSGQLRRRREPRAPGARLGRRKGMRTKTLENHAQGVFSLLFVRCFLLPGRAVRGLALRRCPPSLCQLSLSQRRRVRGSQQRWGPYQRARVTDLTRCWICLEVRISAGSPGTGKGPKKGRVPANTEAETAMQSRKG